MVLDTGNDAIVYQLYVPTGRATEQFAFARQQLADAPSPMEHESGSVLLTADSPLSAASLRAGRKAINFNHIRDQF